MWESFQRGQTSRRAFLTLVASTAALTACSGGDEGSGSTSAPTPASVSDFPRTLGRGFASTTIERRPERVVATADRDQLDVLLALAVRPVLHGHSGDYQPVAPWLDANLVTSLESSSMRGAFEPNFEAIAAARPDLIVDAWAEEAVHARLAKIAPTIQIKLDNTDTWQAAQRLAGAALGQEEQAEQAIDSTTAILTAQRERLEPLAGKSIAVAFVEGGDLVMLPGTEIGARTLTELGLTVHPTPGEPSNRYSLEKMSDLLGGADMIVCFDYGTLKDQEMNRVFRALPAVRNGDYVALSTEVATACYQESTMSLRWAASRVADALLA